MKRFLGVLLGVVFFCTGCEVQMNTEKSVECVQSIDTAMGTIISQTVYVSETENSSFDKKNYTRDILQEITDAEQNLLSWRLDTSELYFINEAVNKQEEILLSEGMAEILKECLVVSKESSGAFDITIGEVVRLWDIDSVAGGEESTAYQLPPLECIENTLANSGYEKLILQGNVLHPFGGMQLDLGAVGKGIALDRIQGYLEAEEEITGAVISVGGSILTYGEKEDGTPWRVGIVDPAETSANLGYLELWGQWCVSTSGDYERYVEHEGVRYHHIIDPETGYPANSGVAGVTILSKDGLLSDALSTACFILGQEKGMELAERFDAEALFVDHEGNLFMTEGMKQYFR